MPPVQDSLVAFLMFFVVTAAASVLAAPLGVFAIILALGAYFLTYSWWTSRGRVHLLVDGSPRCGSWFVLQGSSGGGWELCPRCKRAAESDAAEPSE